jgi:uncharacterized damage-inducible protein DinB
MRDEAARTRGKDGLSGWIGDRSVNEEELMSREALVERFVAGGPELARSIAGLSRMELNAFPVAGTWSIQQIVLHMLDSDLIGCDRMKRVIAEDKPLLIGYNETQFGQRLFYEELETELACGIFTDNRRLTGEILRRVPAETWKRIGIHSEKGAVTLLDLVEGYIEHWEHHRKFIHYKRGLLGKPLAP